MPQLPPPDLPPIGYNPPPQGQATYPYLNPIWYGTESGWGGGGGGGSPSPTPSPTPYPTYVPYGPPSTTATGAYPPPQFAGDPSGAGLAPGQLNLSGVYGTDPTGAGLATSNLNYAPAPDGGTYVYDKNWQYQGYVPPGATQQQETPPQQQAAAPPPEGDTGMGGWGQPAGYFGVAPINQYGSYGVGGQGGSFYGGAPSYTPMGYQGSDLAGIYSGPLPGAYGYYGFGYGGPTGPISVGLGGIPPGQGPSASAAYPNKQGDIGGLAGVSSGHTSIQ